MADPQDEYFNDDDYFPQHERLDSYRPRVTPSPTLDAFNPMWLEQDINNAPLVPLYTEHHGDGLDARYQLYRQYLNLKSKDERFLDILVLHQMSPNDRDVAMHANYYDLDSGDDSDSDSGSDGSQTSIRNRIPPLGDWISDFKSTYKRGRLRLLPLHDAPRLSRPVGSRPHHTAPPITALSSRRLKPVKTRLGLPITIDMGGHAATILACADTGADVNIMSDDMVRTLGLQTCGTPLERKQFILANGKVVGALGQVSAVCMFGTEIAAAMSMSCIFHVLLHAASPIIMGMNFLAVTKTMTEHRDRLVRVPRPNYQALSVCSVGQPRYALACALNQKDVSVTPDTGAEIDLISPSFASQQGLQIHHGEEVIELADGSVEVTSGFIEVNLTISHSTSLATDQCGESHVIAELFILESLRHDILVGEDTLEALEVFTKNKHALTPVSDSTHSYSLNRIRAHGAIEKMWKWISGKISRKRDSLVTTSSGDSTDFLSDQRELDRREQEERRIAKLPAREQDAAIIAEALIQQQYNNTASANRRPDGFSIRIVPTDSSDKNPRKRKLSPSSSTSLTHSMMVQVGGETPRRSRWHHGPITGHSTPGGAIGFNRKGEPIRHNLGHEAPGFYCPFCPDQNRKFARPIELQNHVSVRHVGKAKDDPLLRDVLERRYKVAGSRQRQSFLNESRHS